MLVSQEKLIEKKFVHVICIHDNRGQWITQHRLKPNQSVSTLIPLVGLK